MSRTAYPTAPGWAYEITGRRVRYRHSGGRRSFWVFADETITDAKLRAARDRVIARLLLERQPALRRPSYAASRESEAAYKRAREQAARDAEARSGDPETQARAYHARQRDRGVVEVDYLPGLPEGVGAAWAEAFVAEITRLNGEQS